MLVAGVEQETLAGHVDIRRPYGRIEDLIERPARRRERSACARGRSQNVAYAPNLREEEKRASDGRKPNQLRPIKITRGYIKHAEGSALIEVGRDTRVICTATVEDGVPAFLRDKGRDGLRRVRHSFRSAGAGLPASRRRGRFGGGFTRSSVSSAGLSGRRGPRGRRPENGLDRLRRHQADGGTRTASISGAYVALAEAFRRLLKEGRIERDPLADRLAAVSVGIVDGSRSSISRTPRIHGRGGHERRHDRTGRFVEVQGTAEGAPFGERDLASLLALARRGIRQLLEIQKRTLGG